MPAEEIKTLVQGEVITAPGELKPYSRDASIFEYMPEAAVAPKDAEDVKALVRWASESRRKGGRASLTPRSAGTDMGGGTLTDSVVVEMVPHFNKLVQIKPYKADGESRHPEFIEGPHERIEIAATATVQPGLYYKDFEKETLKKGWLLPTYPASRELCTVGGMAANNSGGEKTLAYGKTEDYIAELKIVMADGEEHIIRALNRQELQAKLAEKSFEGDIYRKLYGLLDKNYEVIKKAKPDVSKNSAGYYLWNVWDREKGIFDLNKLLCGSQGTLGIITEITYRLVRPKPHSLMAVMYLYDISAIADLTNELLKFQPESLECYDDKTLELAIRFFPSILRRVKTNFIKFSFSFLPDLWMLIRYGMPKLVVLAELTGDSEAVIQKRLDALAADIRRFQVKMSIRRHKSFAHHVAEFKLPLRLVRHEKGEEKYWVIRRESFNLLRQHVKGKHTAPVVDDFIVKPEYLGEFLPELQEILDKYSSKMTSTLAGHNGNGNFHVIPLTDFKDPEARAMLKPLMDEVYTLVLKYHGSITAEHNDGIIRTPYLRKMYGPIITGYFEEVKNIFDPQGIFNPGKKVGGNLEEALKHTLKD